jgi:hypothetical protein
MSQHQSTEWADRLQGRGSDALDQLLTAMLDAQQVLTQLPTVAPQQLGDQLSRYWQEHLPGTYQQLADSGVRFLSRLALVSAAYGTEWLREALPGHRLGELGPPPSVPTTPAGADPQQWLGWYVLGAAWAAQQQAWVGRAFTALREEIAGGAIGEEEIQASSQRFLEGRLPDYLAEVSDVGMDLFTDGLAVADGSIGSLASAVLGHRPAAQLTVDVRGPAGTIASAELAIENNRDEAADVRCTVRAAGPHRLTVDPDAFYLAAGRTRRISIRVSLPESATEEPFIAGRVQVSGHGEAPLSLRVRAIALPPRRPITVRALGSPAGGVDTSVDADAPGAPD